MSMTGGPVDGVVEEAPGEVPRETQPSADHPDGAAEETDLMSPQVTSDQARCQRLR